MIGNLKASFEIPYHLHKKPVKDALSYRQKITFDTAMPTQGDFPAASEPFYHPHPRPQGQHLPSLDRPGHPPDIGDRR
jgi:hypothetical protein